MQLLMVGFNPFDVWGSLLQAIWTVFVQGPLWLIYGFQYILTYLTGGVVQALLFGDSTTFSFDTIPKAFWYFVLITFILFGSLFIAQMIIIAFKSTVETKNRIVKCFANSCKAWVFIVLIPIFFFLLNFGIQTMAKAIMGLSSTSDSLPSLLYHAGDPNWDGTGNNTPSSYGPPDNIKSWNVTAEVVATCFTLYTCIMIGMLLVKKIMELFILFVISPIVMAAMVLDDGKAALTWKDMVIAKFLASTSVLLGFYLFTAALEAITKNGLVGLVNNHFIRQFFLIIFIIGGSMAVLDFSGTVAAFVGEGVGIREARENHRSVMAATGGALTIGRALGLFKKAGGSGGLAGAVGGASNMMNSTQGLMSNGIKPLRRGLAMQTGILGLAGVTANLFSRGVGYMAHGTKTAWNAGNRQKFGGKLRGVGRVIAKGLTAPFTGTARAVGKGFKTQYQSGKEHANYARNQKRDKHSDYLRNKIDKHKNKGNTKKMEKFKTKRYRQGYAKNDSKKP